MDIIIDKVLFHMDPVDRRKTHDQMVFYIFFHPLLKIAPVFAIRRQILCPDHVCLIHSVRLWIHRDRGDEHQFFRHDLFDIFDRVFYDGKISLRVFVCQKHFRRNTGIDQKLRPAAKRFFDIF